MRIETDMGGIVAMLLMSIRTSAALVLTPVFSSLQWPLRMRVLFVLALCALMAASLHVSPVAQPWSLGAMLSAALAEVVLGSVLAFGLFAGFGALALGGRIMDLQIGFGIATLIDPATRAQAPLMGTFLQLLAVLVFFAIDGHHWLIRGLAFSFTHLPPGTGLSEMRLDVVVAQFGLMFVYALAVVAPIVFAIFLLDVGLAVMARTMPQVNVFIVSMPLKIFVGLLTFAASLHYVRPLMERIFTSIFSYWQKFLE